MLHNVKNNCYSTLASDISNTATAMTLTTSDMPTAPYYLTFVDNNEVIEVTTSSGANITNMVRGVEGTATTHTAGTKVELRPMAQHIKELQVQVGATRVYLEPSGDATTDTNAIKNAITSGYSITLGIGDFKLVGTGTDIFKMTKPGKVKGMGMDRTRLLVQSSVPSTTDIFRIVPDFASGIFNGFDLSDFAILAQGDTFADNFNGYGRHAIHFDLDDNSNAYPICRSHFERLYIGCTNGRSFYLTNTAKLDGFFTNTIAECLIYRGMKFNRLGDSVQILRNTITGKNWGIESTLVAGANVIKIEDNNITAHGGALKLIGMRYKVRDNNIELTANDGSNPEATIILDSGESQAHLTELTGNTIYSFAGTGAHAVKAYNTTNLYVDNNRLLGDASGGKYDLVIAGNCINTVIGANNKYEGNGLNDSGTNTKQL